MTTNVWLEQVSAVRHLVTIINRHIVHVIGLSIGLNIIIIIIITTIIINAIVPSSTAPWYRQFFLRRM